MAQRLASQNHKFGRDMFDLLAQGRTLTANQRKALRRIDAEFRDADSEVPPSRRSSANGEPLEPARARGRRTERDAFSDDRPRVLPFVPEPAPNCTTEQSMRGVREARLHFEAALAEQAAEERALEASRKSKRRDPEISGIGGTAATTPDHDFEPTAPPVRADAALNEDDTLPKDGVQRGALTAPTPPTARHASPIYEATNETGAALRSPSAPSITPSRSPASGSPPMQRPVHEEARGEELRRMAASERSHLDAMPVKANIDAAEASARPQATRDAERSDRGTSETSTARTARPAMRPVTAMAPIEANASFGQTNRVLLGDGVGTVPAFNGLALSPTMASGPVSPGVPPLRIDTSASTRAQRSTTPPHGPGLASTWSSRERSRSTDDSRVRTTNMAGAS
jgi:hypothetical protein